MTTSSPIKMFYLLPITWDMLIRQENVIWRKHYYVWNVINIWFSVYPNSKGTMYN